MLSLIRRVRPHHVLFDTVLVALSLYASLYLRLGWQDFGADAPVMLRLLPYFIVIRIGTFVLFGVYDIIWRFVSFRDAIKLFKAIVLSSVLILAATYMVNIGRLPRALFFIDLFLVTILLCGSRVLWRLVHEGRAGFGARPAGRAALIYGCGVIGRSFATRIASDATLNLDLVGFIDDSKLEVGRVICGVKVLGTKDDLDKLLETFAVQELIIASGRIPGESLRQVLQVARKHGTRVRIVREEFLPASQFAFSDTVRPIELTDLLNRPRRSIDVEAIAAFVRGQCVAVTGAGGSIGSELVRQIARFEPGKVLLIEHNEFALYQIDTEMQALGEGTIFVPVLADLKEETVLRQTFATHRPSVVLHAAAYKHVHLVEANPFAAILNNIGGTKNLLDVAAEFDVGAFIQISSDKAVRPVGVMGATKRVCELMVTAAGQSTGRTYCSVRFGNVLGSSGSLIPLLSQQIQRGGPITITHEDMRRFFMLTSEAVGLVLKAATVASPGDVLILRMGEPIRIVDIARAVLALHGLSENEIPLVFTGLRPGEKMFEELYLCGNEVQTSDPDILTLPRGDAGEFFTELEYRSLAVTVDHLLSGALAADPRILEALSQLANGAPWHTVRSFFESDIHKEAV